MTALGSRDGRPAAPRSGLAYGEAGSPGVSTGFLGESTSILYDRGDGPPYVMEQMGHTDPKVTLGIYAKVMRRSEGERELLRAIVEGTVPARFGANRVPAPVEAEVAQAA